MNNLLKERLNILLGGEKTVELIDCLHDKFVTIHPDLTSAQQTESIDSVIRTEFQKVRQEICKDLDQKKVELETKKNAIYETNCEADRCTELGKKMLVNLKDNLSGQEFITADDMLERMQARDILNDEDYKSFETVLRQTFDSQAETYWNEQIESCMIALEKVRT